MAEKIRVLLIHNRYQQRGGEDAVFEEEAALLRASGIFVETLVVTNEDVRSLPDIVATASLVVYNPFARRTVARVISEVKPTVVHVHNFFPRLSPSIFLACRQAKVPVVWTLHNFRITCANGLLFREGHPCEKCVDSNAFWGAVHRCYRGTFLGSVAVAGMIAAHRKARTWSKHVDRFITLTNFSKGRIAAAGIPTEKIVVKPNSIEDPQSKFSLVGRRSGAVFVGRLSKEKGVDTLLEAWRSIEAPLVVIGSGPEEAHLRSIASSNVSFVGHQDKANIYRYVSNAELLIVPSRWYENFPMVIVEAMALSTPVVCSRIGALQELIEEGDTGFLFKVNDPGDLARVVSKALSRPEVLTQMGIAARRKYELFLTPERNLEALLSIYNDVISQAADDQRQ